MSWSRTSRLFARRPPTMSVVAPPITARDAEREPAGLLTRLHEWVVTVDHKHLGVMYVVADLAFPRLTAFGFWVFLFGAVLLYFSFLGGDGLYGAGSAPDVGWFAYAPLTGRAFSPGNSTDYWNLSILVTGFGTVATSINLVA